MGCGQKEVVVATESLRGWKISTGGGVELWGRPVDVDIGSAVGPAGVRPADVTESLGTGLRGFSYPMLHAGPRQCPQQPRALPSAPNVFVHKTVDLRLKLIKAMVLLGGSL